MATKHSHALNGCKTGTYTSWQAMLERCGNPKFFAYERYGGRGIKVCDRWKSFVNFLADMGERPDGKTLDRYPDNNGNYEPGNCRWATRKEQSQNTSSTKFLTLDGETLSLSEWGRRWRVNHQTITKLLLRGMTTEQIRAQCLLNPSKPMRRYVVNGESLLMSEMLIRYAIQGVSIKMVRRRINRLKWTPMLALTTPPLPAGQFTSNREET